MARADPERPPQLRMGEARERVGRPLPSPHGFPRRAEGVELLGRYEGSGLKDPPYLARRPDGQVIQLPLPLYAIVEAADGSRSVADISRHLDEQVGLGIEAEAVEMLIDKRLRTIGLLAAADGSNPTFKKLDPLLALKYKKGVVPARLVSTLTAIFRFLFLPPVVLGVLAAIVAMDVWLFGVHGVAQGIRQTIYAPALLAVLFALVVVGAALHEIGHATACAYGGGEPGEMGVGLYVVWPAFYTDVTDAYRLGRGARLRTDLGGIYFNGVFSLILFGVYLLTGVEFLLLAILVQHFAVLQQLLPFLRLDGYYVIADLTGVPDMFARIRPILASLAPWRKPDERVRELKWWARAVVTGWVMLLVPAMLFILGSILLHLPRIVATAADSWGRHWDDSRSAFGKGNMLAGTGSIGELIVLSLPAAGALLTTSRVGKRVVGGGWRATGDRPIARAAFLTGLALITGTLAYLWWPNDDYEPIGPTERWTIQDAAVSFAEVPGGAPGLAPAHRADAQDDLEVEPAPVEEQSSETNDASELETDETSPSPTPSATTSASPSPMSTPSPSPTPTASPSPSPSPSPSGT